MAKSKTLPLDEAIHEVLAEADDSLMRGPAENDLPAGPRGGDTDQFGAGAYDRTENRTGYPNSYMCCRPRTDVTG